MPASKQKCGACKAENDAHSLYCTTCGKSMQSAFAPTGGGVAGGLTPNPSPEAAATETEELLQRIAVASEFATEKTASGYQVTVPLGEDRKQRVHVVFSGHDDEGHDVISFMSICGAYDAKHASTLLRFNSKLTYGSFAIKTVEGQEYFVVTSNQLASAASADGIRKVLFEIARRADGIEAQLSKGQDVF
jgi:hypothetical protein